MEKQTQKILPGFYKSWNGKTIYVIGVFPDYDTKEETVVLREESYSNAKYYTLSPQAFLQTKLKATGKILPRFDKHAFNPKPPKEPTLTEISDKGFRPSRMLGFRIYSSYEEYAKILLKNLSADLDLWENGWERAHYTFPKKDWQYFEMEMNFCQRCLEETLHKYWTFTKEHYIEKISIRKYVEKHNLNRGSVEHLNKMLIKDFAKCLQEWDKKEHTSRVK